MCAFRRIFVSGQILGNDLAISVHIKHKWKQTNFCTLWCRGTCSRRAWSCRNLDCLASERTRRFPCTGWPRSSRSCRNSGDGPIRSKLISNFCKIENPFQTITKMIRADQLGHIPGWTSTLKSLLSFGLFCTKENYKKLLQLLYWSSMFYSRI